MSTWVIPISWQYQAVHYDLAMILAPGQMTRPIVTLGCVSASTVIYSLISHILLRSAPRGSIQARLKGLSAVHATVVTPIILLALSASPLHTRDGTGIRPGSGSGPKYASDGYLDDSENPVIQEQSDVANALTAWETGYLLYDTWAMVHYAQPRRSFIASAATVAKSQPALFGHHLLLSAAFMYLQVYIMRSRERGIWIIITFMLMNASNPLMHARWFLRRAGRSSRLLDVVFAAVFAATRFGTVAWALQRYGAWNGLGGGQVFSKLRRPCQVGTGALLGLNALWWAVLLRGIVKRARDSDAIGKGQ